MLTSEEQINSMLSKSENTVYEYIKSQCHKNGQSIKESMKQIGDKIDLSEATVHRAVRKLRKEGIIGVVPSVEKAESNEIIYFGLPDPNKQVRDIFELINLLSSNASRFESLLEAKEKQIEKLIREKEILYQRVDELEQIHRNSLAESVGLDKSKIVSSQALGDGTTAYIVRN